MDIKSKILEEAEANGVNVINLADAMEKCPLLARVIKACENKLAWHGIDIGGGMMSNWISVDVRLPSIMDKGEESDPDVTYTFSDDVKVMLADGSELIGYYEYDDGIWLSPDFSGHPQWSVTHWAMQKSNEVT